MRDSEVIKDIILFAYPYKFENFFINKDVIQLVVGMARKYFHQLVVLTYDDASKTIEPSEIFLRHIIVKKLRIYNRVKLTRLINLLKFYGVFLGVLLKNRKIRIVMTYHMGLPSLFLSLIAKIFKKRVIIKLDINLKDSLNLFKDRSSFSKILINFTFSLIDLGIIETKRTFEIFQDNLNKKYKEKLIYIPNGIDVDSLNFVNGIESGEMTKDFSMIYIGRMNVHEKNFPLLHEILSSLLITGLSVHLVGDADIEQAKSINELKLILSERGINLQFHGSLERLKLFELLKKTRVLVLTSSIESYGLVLNEASLFGLTIISTDVGAASDIINRYDNGFLFKDAIEFHRILEMISRKTEKIKIREDFAIDYNYDTLLNRDEIMNIFVRN